MAQVDRRIEDHLEERERKKEFSKMVRESEKQFKCRIDQNNVQKQYKIF